MGYGDIEIKTVGKFLKIEAGVPRDVRILNDTPGQKLLHGFGKETVPCGGEGCLICEKGTEPVRQRFVTNVYDFTTKRVLLWEFGSMIAKQLKKIDESLSEENKKITDVDLKVEATGSGMNTKYSVTPRMSSKQVPPGLTLHPFGDKEEIPF